MSIKPNLPNNPNVEIIKANESGIFTNCIFKAIPVAFDESMSYYETLCGLLYYLKEVVIPTVNNNADAVSELQNLYEELKTYVDDYFTNLDVQQEINNKLDEMTENGTLTTLIGNYVDPIFQNYQTTVNNRLDNQDKQITNLTTQITSVSSGAPIPASSTSDMTNTSKIYVNTTDGKLYYYNGTNWVAFGTYQSTSIGENTISYKMFDDFLKNSMGITIPSVTITNGAYLNGGAIIPQNGYSYTSPIELKKGQRLIAIVRGYQSNISLLVKCDSEGNNRSTLIQSTDSTDVVINYVADIDMYVMLCSNSNVLSYYYIDENLKYKLSNLSEIVTDDLTNIDLGEITNNTYINNMGNVIQHPYGAYSSTDYIDISPSKNYKLTGINWTFTDNVGYAFYDKNKNFISFVKNPVENNFLITSPSNAYYIRLTLKTPTIIKTNFYIITNLVEIENKITNLNKNEDIDKFDLFRSFNSFGVIGDSLASGESVSVVDGQTQYVDNYNYSWGQFIAKKYGMKCINFSAGGLTTRSWLTSHSGLSKLQNEDNKCNAYIIGLGVNDYTLGSSYIGSSSDIHVDNPTLNEDTFYGNYGKIISNIKLVQPKAKIFLFTCPDQTNPSTRDYSNLNTAIRTIATLFTNVYIIDLASDYNSYFNSGFMASNLRGGHYNAISYSYISDMLFNWLSTYMKNNYTDFRQIEFIGTDYNYYN